MSYSQPFAVQPYSYSERVSYLSDNDLRDEGDLDDVWHVQLAPDDVKVMTLEQLDDAIRLDLVSSSTQVWKRGMVDWLPLGTAVGFEEIEPSPPPQRPVPPPPKLQVVPPAPASRSMGPAASYVPAAQSTWPAPQSSPAPSSGWPTAQSSPAPSSGWPPVIQNPLYQSGVQQSTHSLRAPFAESTSYDVYPSSRARYSNPFGTYMLFFALAIGAVVTLYRNDKFLDVARRFGMEDRYLSLEKAAFGGPSLGTPRGLESILVARDKQGDSRTQAQATSEEHGNDSNADATGEENAEATGEEEETRTRLSDAPTSGAASHEEQKTAETLTESKNAAETAQSEKAASSNTTPGADKDSTAKQPIRKVASTPPPKPQRAVSKPKPEPKAAPPAPKKVVKAAPKPAAKRPAPKRRQAAKPKAPSAPVAKKSSGGFDLVGAMREAVNHPKPKKKQAPRNADYDPLNGNL